MNTVMTAGPGTRWWVAGDWNGFFGLFTNVLLNVIVLTTLCLYVVHLPGDIVYGRVLPALGIAILIAFFFAFPPEALSIGIGLVLASLITYYALREDRDEPVIRIRFFR